MKIRIEDSKVGAYVPDGEVENQKDLLVREYIGQDATQPGLPSTIYSASERRPNLEALNERIGKEIRQAIKVLNREYGKLVASSAENPMGLFCQMVRSYIFDKYYPGIDPLDTDLCESFTLDRIRKEVLMYTE